MVGCNMKRRTIFFIVLSAAGFDGFIMSMAKKTVPALKRSTNPRTHLSPVSDTVVLYGDSSVKKHRNRQAPNNMKNQGALSIESLFSPDSLHTGEILLGKSRGFEGAEEFNARLDLLLNRARELGLLLDEGDSVVEDQLEPVRSLSKNNSLTEKSKLGDIVRSVDIEKPLRIQNIIQKFKQAKLDAIYEIFQGLRIQDEFISKKDLMEFLDSTVMKSIQGFMILKIRYVLTLLQYDVSKTISQGLASDSLWMQIMTVRSFFMPINALSLPSAYPLFPLVLANAFSQAICELLVGKPLTLEEFQHMRKEYSFLLNSLEKSITLALWVVMLYFSVKIVHMLHESDDYKDEVRAEAQDVLLRALFAA